MKKNMYYGDSVPVIPIGLADVIIKSPMIITKRCILLGSSCNSIIFAKKRNDGKILYYFSHKVSYFVSHFLVISHYVLHKISKL